MTQLTVDQIFVLFNDFLLEIGCIECQTVNVRESQASILCPPRMIPYHVEQYNTSSTVQASFRLRRVGEAGKGREVTFTVADSDHLSEIRSVVVVVKCWTSLNISLGGRKHLV